DTSSIRFSHMLELWLDNWQFFVIVLGSVFVILLAETLKYYLLIYTTTKQYRFKLALKVAIFGKYYDNITPLGSGGQAFQMYYLNKGGIPSGVSGALPIFGFFFMQFAFFILGLFVFLFNSQVVTSGLFRILAWVGLFFAIIIPFSFLMVSLLPKIGEKIVHFVINLAIKIKIIKNKQKWDMKIHNTIMDYKESIQVIKNSHGTLVILFVLSIIYQVILCSIPYFVVRACGISASWIDVFSLCVFTYAAISFFPTPGNSGAAEISFAMIFTVLSAGYMFWAVILWRIGCYYMFLVIGLILMISTKISEHQKEKIKLFENSIE
ncbi:MAG: lysylphosphatidylglycerol synthase transmembrane domain-containing protein, partial [Candidatus Izemoplasmatales bacterium]|nr:lysylphosphatidylglycerol synthase transmembrane domain-containing protein [Candidatus Izemoplasmatales bacterium]